MTKKTSILLLAPALLLAGGQAMAQATAKPDGQMRAAIGLGASLTSGNSRSTTLSLVADAVRMTDQDKLSLYGNAQYAKTNGVTGTDLLRAGARYDWNIGPAYFAFGSVDLERNKPANLSLRGSLAAGLGWHVIKSPTTTFDVFGGVGYIRDSYDQPMVVNGLLRDTYGYPSLLIGEESTHKLSDTTSFKQRLVIKPNLKDRGEFLANFDAGLAVAMSKTMNLTVGLSAIHNSDPGIGRKQTDTLLTTGVSVKFD